MIQQYEHIEQGTEEWLDARRGKLTGSNVGAALGLSPWQTPEELIRQMVREYHGAPREFSGNIATDYGTLHEPLAAMEYFAKTGNLVEECGFFVHPEHDWLGSSPDGLVSEHGLVEIKCPFSLRNDKSASFKSIDDQPHYYAQVQIELACTGRQWCDFYQWSKHGDLVERVEYNQEWFEDNLPKLREFYEWYLSEVDNPAHLEEKEKEINTFHAKKLVEEWDDLGAQMDNAAARKKEILEELVALAGDRNAVIFGRKLTKIERKGGVDYGKVPELQGIDLEPYRRKPSEYWRLS